MGTEAGCNDTFMAELSVTGSIIMLTFAVIYLHHLGGVMYLIFIYIAFCVVWFIAKNEECI